MEHFYHNIQGWFDFQVLYTAIVDTVADNSTAHFVEVGSWKGTSSAYMAVEIINSGKSIRFDCVDTWQGSEEIQHKSDLYIQQNELYDHFISNMKPVEGKYNAVRLASVAASELYDDASLDFVFLDAGHRYEDITADIKAWQPKVKPGGILAGHDYHYPDVTRAVNEAFFASGIATDFVATPQNKNTIYPYCFQIVQPSSWLVQIPKI